ncbi:MAG: CYTH domain-containing protein [Acholeplasmatales bacterium]|jgi:uncharacterized protein YjbK|nr:CYTH domain-containing protein [Acholeplasmatales bacterium]
MKVNKEIEFKCQITEEKYLELINLYQLENNIFRQTNFYFDTDDFLLMQKHIVLRIRKKSEKYYKITLKSESLEEIANFEKHYLLNSPEKAIELITNGFEVNTFFKEINYKVYLRAQLDNYRVSIPHEVGQLFFDKCEYYGKTDYEIEYEVDDYIEGQKVFARFLKSHQIPFVATQRKSVRALELAKNN